jgi:rhodanese-related sulfurtransferase
MKIISILSLILFSCMPNNDKELINKTISKSEFKEKIQDENTILVDVRTKEENSEGAIENSLNIDFNSPNFTSEIIELDTSKAVYLYCRSGGRSEKARLEMKDLGFKEVYDLEGGFLEWD